MGEPGMLKRLSAREGCTTFSGTLLPLAPYLRKYSDCPVFEGILWLYLAGVGTSDTLTTSIFDYSSRSGNFGSYRSTFWGCFQRSCNFDVRDWRGAYPGRARCGCVVWAISELAMGGTRDAAGAVVLGSESGRPRGGCRTLCQFYWSWANYITID